MEMIKCAKCQNELPKKSPTCQSCGAPNKLASHLSGKEVLILLIPVFLLLWWLAKGSSPSAEDAQKTDQLLNAARIYFKNNAVGDSWGGWQVSSVAVGDHGNVINATIAIPDKQAQEILSRPPEARLRAVGWNSCPRKSDPIWKVFSNNETLYVQATYSGNVFIDVDCARWNLP